MKWALFVVLYTAAALGQTAPVGDVYQTNSNGAAESPQAAYSKLYQLTAQIVQYPAAGYQPPKVDDWPEITAAQKAWYDAMISGGGQLSAADRDRLVPGADHLMNAINDMERGYRIQITQKTWSAQQTVKKLYANAQDEFALCNASGVKNPETSGQPSSGAAASSSADTLTPGDVDSKEIYQLQAEVQDTLVTPIPTSPEPMDMVGDHLLRGLQDWAISTLNMLLEEPGRPMNDLGEAIANYMNRSTNENHAALQAAAAKAVQQFEEDPARTVGAVAPNFLPLPKVKALQQLAGVEKAAEEVVAIGQAEKQFTSVWNPETPVEPSPVIKESNGMPPSGFAENSCFSTAIAQDQLWRSDENFQIAGVQNTGQRNLLTTEAQVRQQLAAKFPDAGTTSSAFTPTQLDELTVGQPIQSSPQQIGNYLRGREGNQGLVFVKNSPTTDGHVSNVRYYQGQIEYLDVPNNTKQASWIGNPNARVWFFPTTP